MAATFVLERIFPAYSHPLKRGNFPRWNGGFPPNIGPMFLDRLLTLIANLLPLAGVWWWGWDTFEVLVLYWMQTVLHRRLHGTAHPQDSRNGLGMIKVDGRTRGRRRAAIAY